MQDGDFKLFKTRAIMRYLAARKRVPAIPRRTIQVDTWQWPALVKKHVLVSHDIKVMDDDGCTALPKEFRRLNGTPYQVFLVLFRPVY